MILAFPAGIHAAGKAAPVRIAFIDSGISTRHIDASRVEEGKNYVFPDADTQDRIGHGTATAGLVLGSADQGIRGICPSAVAVPLVVVDAYPSGTVKNGGPEALVEAIYDAVDLFGCDILNISLSTTADSEELQAAVAHAEDAGALIVAAVGNDGASGPVYYPAAYGTVVAVGSAQNKLPADFSQSGADVLTDGVALLSATNKNGASPSSYSGTSYSCAAISGLCARMKASYPGASAKALRMALCVLSEDVCEPGKDSFSGWGYVPARLWDRPADPAGSCGAPRLDLVRSILLFE